MKLLLRKWQIWSLGIVVVSVMVCIAGEKIENLKVRLECYPSGEVKTELFAKLADVAEDGSITAYGVTLKRYRLDGVLDVRVDAKDCHINQDNQTASSTNHVVLHRGPLVVSGDGFNWDGDKNRLKITKNARVEFPTAIIKEEGVLKHVVRNRKSK
jgi:hypothetical protein